MADTDNSVKETGPVTEIGALSTAPAGPAAKNSSRSRRRRRCIIPVACVTAFILLMNAGISLLLVQWRQPETASFDMTGTVNRFMSQLAGQHLSDDAVKATTARFNAALEASLTDWQQHHGGLILVSPAVVGGAPDITDDIQADVAQRMAAD